MKKTTIIISSFLALLTSCEKYLDVNDDPNYTKDKQEVLILPAAQVSVANVFSADYGLLGSFWSQHWAQDNTSSQYKEFETYSLSGNFSSVDRSYSELYYGGLADNEIVLLKAGKEENWGLYLITATLKAFAFQYLVDLYDNVPYNEAFKGQDGILNPEINTGQEVYDSIYSLLNNALSKDMSNFKAEEYKDSDLILGANLNDWKAFANTLKLRILLRQYYARTSYVQSELSGLLSNATFLTKDVLLVNFGGEDDDSKRNPLYETDQAQLGVKNNIRANATFISYLKANNDTRMSALFDSVGGDILGFVTGSYSISTSVLEGPDVIANPKWEHDMPVSLMTVAESELLLAEAYLRLNDEASAKIHYENGVKSSFKRIGAEIGDLLTTSYAFPSDSAELQLEAIIMQKWVDAAEGQRGIESFIEQVRTGYPKVSEVSSSVNQGYNLPSSYVPGTLIYSKQGATGGKFPVRLPYPDTEMNFNSNAEKYKNLTDSDVLLTKVWWNK